VLHTGSRAADPDDAHHMIEFGTEWDATFAQLERGELMSDPSFLLSTPTRSDPSLAPDGRHTHYALFPAPNLDPRRAGHLDWARERDRYRDHIVATLERRGHPGFGAAIECEHLVTPADWRAQGIAAGAPFGAAHSFAQTGPFRPPTLDRRVENLVFTGANTQPGVGVPMVLVSGELAAQRVTGKVLP
jgi:phytoene desaturase